MATTTHRVVSEMTSEVTLWSDSPITTICASATMGLPHTENHRLSTHTPPHQPSTSRSVHLISPLDVHGRSFLTHMVVTTTRSWYLCLLLRQTQTKGVILTTGCSQRQTGSDLLSRVWIKLQDISSNTKTPSHPLSGSSSVPQKTASQGQPQSQKCLTHGLTKSAERCWGPDGLLTEKSTEEGGLEQRHSCPSDELRHRPHDYLLG